MTAALFLIEPKPPEWLHSSRYFLLALVLHGLVVLYPLSPADKFEITPPSPLLATLHEQISAPPAPAPVLPDKAPKQATPHREKTAPAAPPIIAMAPEQVSAPATYVAPAPILVPSPPAPSTAASNPAATVSAVRFDAAYLHNPHPAYPLVSRRIGEEGKVLLKVVVTADGRAATVDVEKSSHFERLDEAARQSVARWRFVPARRGDEAIEASVIVPVVFRLDN